MLSVEGVETASEAATLFDRQWYLQQYPDVADAGVDPFWHYQHHGQAEGRWPCLFSAFVLEQQLWQQQAPQAYPQLQLLSQQQGVDAALAALVLARWFCCFGQWARVVPLVMQFFACPQARRFAPEQQPWLIAFTAAWQQNAASAAKLCQQQAWPDSHDKRLAQAMLLPLSQRLNGLNQIWQQSGLAVADLQSLGEPVDGNIFDQLGQAVFTPTIDTAVSNRSAQPLVSVLMPLYNAAATVTTALQSLLQQQYHELEIIVVDDGSTDHSAAVVKQLAATDRRITLLQQPNSGAYVARNLALRHAKGAFITTHDADDWSHPQKIAWQVQALLQQPTRMAAVSAWVRCSPALEFQHWRVEHGWIYRNVSSLMFRRTVHQQLGFWDRVAVNADTEFYYRIRQVFGADSIIEVAPTVPLALGRADPFSLSQTSLTHLRTQYAGVRRAYHEAALAWQQQSHHRYLTAVPLRRPFAVPERICRGTPEQKRHNQRLLIAQSRWFDPAWYLATYPDVAASGLDCATHYLQIGAAQGYDPGPDFSTVDYRRTQHLAVEVNPLLHLLAAELDRQALWQPDY